VGGKGRFANAKGDGTLTGTRYTFFLSAPIW
jgi:hypothetical protein